MTAEGIGSRPMHCGCRYPQTTQSCTRRCIDRQLLFRTSYWPLDSHGALRCESVTDRAFLDGIEQLVRQELVIPSDLDELDRARYLLQSSKFNYAAIEMAILTTRDCNFRCTYCTENGAYNDSHLDPEMARTALEYAKAIVEAKGTSHVKVAYYGGEPLLNLDTLLFSAQQFHAAFKNTSMQLVLFVITNGYLLTPSTFDKLARAGVRTFQITLDGPRAIHDERRHLSSGGGTWDRIVTNIQHVVHDSRMDSLGIRINVDAHNAGSIPCLLDELVGQEILEDPRVQLYVAPVIPASSPANNWNRYMLDGQEKARTFVSLWEEMAARNLPVGLFPNIFPCGIRVEWGTLVDPSGDLYACAGFVGMDEHVKGRLPDGGISPEHIHFLVEDPPEACIRCTWVPICGGGCKYVATIKGHRHCEKAFLDVAYPTFIRLRTLQKMERSGDSGLLAACL